MTNKTNKKAVNFGDYIQFHDKQKEAFQYIGKGYRIFFGGARGGGKSAFALASAVACAKQFPGITIVCVRRRYFDLQQTFIYPLLEYYPQNVFKYKYIKKEKIAIFSTEGTGTSKSSKIIFKACDTEADAQDIQGVEFQLMIIDEANNLDENVLHRLTGSLRKSKRMKGLKGFKTTLLMTGNPGGRSDTYFRTRFVEPDYSYWTDYELKHKDKFIFISSGPFDNPYLDKDYISWLESLPKGLRDAWLYGRWDVFNGQFFEEWNPRVHVVSSFDPPKHWERIAGLDLGFSDKHPTVCLWGAKDPETGVIHIYREAVLKGDVESQARIIASMQEGEEINMFLADPSMFGEQRKMKASDDSPSMIFAKAGISMIPANNDRINGWRIVKQWMHWDENHPPRIVFHDVCTKTIQSLPSLRYATTGNTEDMDTKQPYDDFADALRYMLISGNYYEVDNDLSYDDVKSVYEEEEEIFEKIEFNTGRIEVDSGDEYGNIRKDNLRDDDIAGLYKWNDDIMVSNESIFV